MKLETIKSELISLGYHAKLVENELSAGVITQQDSDLGGVLVNYWMTITLGQSKKYILENHRKNLDTASFSSKYKLISHIKKEFPL